MCPCPSLRLSTQKVPVNVRMNHFPRQLFIFNNNTVDRPLGWLIRKYYHYDRLDWCTKWKGYNNCGDFIFWELHQVLLNCKGSAKGDLYGLCACLNRLGTAVGGPSILRVKQQSNTQLQHTASAAPAHQPDMHRAVFEGSAKMASQNLERGVN